MARTAFSILLGASLTACSPSTPDNAAIDAGSHDNGATPAAVAETPDVPPPAGDARASRYTSLADCPVVRENMEEGAYRLSECPGLGGRKLRLVDADARHNLIVVAADGSEHSLNLPSSFSGAFSTIGDRVEWRGPAEGVTFRPDAIVIRYDAFLKPETPEVPVSHLVVISLGDRPCVTARIDPGDAQNERARSAADALGPCLRPV